MRRAANGGDAMNLSRDETRALGFVALLLALSAGVRLIDRPRPVTLEGAGVDIGALEAASRAAAEAKGPEPLRPGEKLDPNSARLEDLLRLPRIRRTTAQAILAARSAQRFESIADLDRVPGVGPVALEAWKPHLTLPERRPAAGPAPQTPAAPAMATATVALNAATAQDLERLPGIGPALAARIIAWRDSAGGFRSLDDLTKVRGIGPATLRRLKPLMTLH